MNTELFIARRLFSAKEQSPRLSRRIVRLAVAGVSVGMTVMLLAVATVAGFQQEIEDKVNGFAANFQIVNYHNNYSFQTDPVMRDDTLLRQLRALPQIRHIQQFATKPGMIKADSDLQGIVLKGITDDFDWQFFEKARVNGARLNPDSTQVWISKKLSDLLRLPLGKRFRIYFLNEGEQVPRIRQFTVAGIYDTGFEEFDRMFILAGLKHVQRLSDWEDNQISGYEVFVNRDVPHETIEERIADLVFDRHSDTRPLQRVDNIRRKYPQIFDWLNLLDMNAIVILTLMIAVAGFNMISGLLVIILERAAMIGALKAMGAGQRTVRRIFLYLAFLLTGQGLLWGNMLGLGLYMLQKHFGIVKLDPHSYYVATMPVSLSAQQLLTLNLVAFVATMLMLVVPSLFISRISPAKTLRFE
ncbi:MAG: ABC transporter permease [Bacteroidales bacterium]|nr:ABC transporter permease [Bacteroidales bacterium]